MTDGLLAGRVAFVTGGAQGIGFALADRFSAEGARVMIGDLQSELAENVADELRRRGRDVRAVHLDVTDPKSVGASVKSCAEAFGEPDVLVANAGILLLRPVLDISPEDWQRVVDVNLTGVFLTSRAFARRMVEQGVHGRIIVTSSLFGRRGGAENGAYSASKFGVIGLVESLAAELAPYEILVNAVCPGQVETPMIRGLLTERAQRRGVAPEAIEAELLAKVPLRRMATPDEVADVFVFLASPLSRYITGQSLIVDGGWQVG